MVNFRKGDAVQGKANWCRGLIGKVKQVISNGKFDQYTITWNDGKESTCGLRSLGKPGDRLEPSNRKKRKCKSSVRNHPGRNVESDGQDADEVTSSDSESNSSSEEENESSESENDENR